jgi:hypothetical protein
MAVTIDRGLERGIRIPEELLESKYAINRDEMLWRVYERELVLSDPDRGSKALMVWHIIKEVT